MKNLFKQIYGNLFFKSTSLDSKEIKEQSKKGFKTIGYFDNTIKLEFENKFGIKIENCAIFEQALTHRSYLQVLSFDKINSNERLEFLGDAVLNMVVTDYLFANYTNEMEGSLSKLRSMMVNKSALARCAKELELDRFIRVSHGAEKELKSGNETIISDAMEALIAAIYIDSGYKDVTNFIVKTLIPIIIKNSMLEDSNYKSKLMELVQKNGKKAPIYQVVEDTGPAHDKKFVIAVLIEGEIKGTGIGRNKKEAEQKAALAALDNL